MARLLVHVEGVTEEDFTNKVLCPHLVHHGYTSVGARRLGNARQRDRRHGIKPWPIVRCEIARHLSQDSGAIATTMVDYYALPAAGDGAWPWRAEAARLPFVQRGPAVQAAMSADIGREMGPSFNSGRFVPFVTMHEFEGLLFSDCQAFATAIMRPELAATFQSIRDGFESPEEINDSPLTAPSKRVEQLVRGYQKPLLGISAALEIGLPAIRAACPHFNAWISALEAAAGAV